MPKAKIEFNLPEEKEEFNLWNNAGEYCSALWKIDQECRTLVKHGHIYDSVEDLAEYIRSLIPESLYEV